RPALSSRRPRPSLSHRRGRTTLSHRRDRTRLSAPGLWLSLRSRRRSGSRGELSLLLFRILLGPLRSLGWLCLGECLPLFILLLLRRAAPARKARRAFQWRSWRGQRRLDRVTWIGARRGWPASISRLGS